MPPPSENAAGKPEAPPWRTGPPQPPIGQYRISLVTTADDLGPDALVWMIRSVLHNILHIHPLIESVERIYPLDEGTR